MNQGETREPRPATAPAIGDFVVVPDAPAVGVGRLERLLPPKLGEPQARIFFYVSGTFAIFALARVKLAPAGPWPKARA